MNEIEKNKLYEETTNTLIALKNKELSLLGDFAYVGNAVVISAIIMGAIVKTIDTGANLTGPLAIGGIGLITSLVSYFIKKNIIKKAHEEAADIVNKPKSQNLTQQNAFTISHNFHSLNFANPFDVETEAQEVTDYDNLSLEAKCNLLIGYAREVSYPGFEEEAHILCDIIDGLSCDDEEDKQTYVEALKIVEQTMLEKAYKFYNGDLSR